MWRTGLASAAALCAIAGAALAQDKPAAGRSEAQPPQTESSGGEARRKAGDILSQPARDVGVSKTEIPPVLVEAAKDPYTLTGLKTCRQLSAAVKDLNAALGPDFQAGAEVRENKAAKLAEAGGKTVVNSILPFRGLVREISGAAPAERSLNAAVDAGYARRGFLRGVHRKQGCKTGF
jgi:hypothetical protein